ncbi:MAG: hypothetical protein HC868_13900 [Sphingomonadales bacterium]|nr:hypothetical protein [Sphingomonadales bacterium]
MDKVDTLVTDFSTSARQQMQRVEKTVEITLRRLEKTTSGCPAKAFLVPVKQVRGVAAAAGAVLDTQELNDDPTFEQRGIMQTIEHPKSGPFKVPAWPVRHNGQPPEVKPSPLLGEHTDDVLKAWLSMSERDVAALKSGGVV